MLNGSAKAQRRAAEKNGQDATPPPPAKPPKRDHEVYFDLEGGRYHYRVGDEYKPFREESLSRLLRSKGYHREAKHANSLNFLENELLRIQMENGVWFCGKLAGYAAGEHTVCGERILVTRGPALPKPKQGKFPVLGKFLGELFTEEAKPYFLAWLKAARRALDAGPPWAPGQAVVLCGPPGCGKNLLQAIITEILGGRAGKPYRYMSGDTSFNKDLLSAEHLCIQDEVEHPDHKARRFFGARIKDFAVNSLQSYHPKGRDAFNLTPFWRLTISLNEEVENLQILPPLEVGLSDKIMLFRCRPTDLPITADDPKQRALFWEKLTEQIPAFLFWLRSWRVPPRCKDARFGVAAFHDPSLVADLQMLSPEEKLWNLINTADLWAFDNSLWRGSSAELERVLRSKHGAECDRLLRFANATGVYLEKLTHTKGARIQRERGKDNTRVWVLHNANVVSTNGHHQEELL